MRNLLISPHQDDEALFCSYIIQTYKPLVVILTDSFIQPLRGETQCNNAIRTAESIAAMKILSAEVIFCHIPDKDFNVGLCEKALLPYSTILNRPYLVGENFGCVFAPSATEGGNWMHDVTGQVADKLFPGIVSHYSTYTKDREYPDGHTLIFATEEMKAKKLEALKCYQSQMTNCCRQYFVTSRKDEFLCK